LFGESHLGGELGTRDENFTDYENNNDPVMNAIFSPRP
jgi:hypothetical protein